MRTARLQSKLLAAGLTAVLTLPYAAPTVCGALGRMGDKLETSADAPDTAVRAPASGDMCCTLSECGVPQGAPVAFALNVLQQTAIVHADLPALPSAHSANALLPPKPPPRPSLSQK